MSTDTTQKPSWWNRIAHPGQFVAWTTPLLWPLTVLTALLFVAGLWFAFFNSPADYQMGDTVRIMYVHVPNAWLSQFVYVTMSISALGTLVWRHPLADVSMKAAAPLGALFTALALDRKSTRLNSSHVRISYAVFCLKKKNTTTDR